MHIQACRALVMCTLLVGVTHLTISGAKAQGIENQTNTVAAGDINRAAAANPSSCTGSNSLFRRVDFADLQRARRLLEHRDAWARQLSNFDMGVRQKTAQPAGLREFIAFAASAGMGWTTQEEAGWRALVHKLSTAMSGLNLHLPNIDIVKTTGAEEFDAAYTRVGAIMFPQSAASAPATAPRHAYFLLAHEVFHVLSRADPSLRNELYALLGFKTVRGFEYPSELEERRVSNPDAFEYLHTLSVQTTTGSVDVLPVNQSLASLQDAIQLPNFFEVLDIVLLPVDTRTGQVRRDATGNLIKYSFANTNWVSLMLRNSSFIIHPEEVLADNFAALMEWRADGVLPTANPSGFPINDVNLLVAMQNVLASGCRKCRFILRLHLRAAPASSK